MELTKQRWKQVGVADQREKEGCLGRTSEGEGLLLRSSHTTNRMEDSKAASFAYFLLRKAYQARDMKMWYGQKKRTCQIYLVSYDIPFPHGLLYP